MGEQLSKKPFTWMSWWWGLKWGSFISITPKLSKEIPLWIREDSSLNSLRLFGLHPTELQAEICRYWTKPFWRRWVSRLFTSINSKIKVWSYYQRCMSFREIQKENLLIERSLISCTNDHGVIAELVNWLNRDNLQFENYLERHCGDLSWIQKNFRSRLEHYGNKRKLSFFKLVEKKLKKIPVEFNRNAVRIKAKQEYQQLASVLHNYLWTWYENTYSQLSSNSNGKNMNNTPVSDELVYVGPGTATRNELQMNFSEESDLGSMSAVGAWVNNKRLRIESLLQKESPGKYSKIQTLLEESLNDVKLLIEPQIEKYKALIEEVTWGKVDCKQAIEFSEKLQTRLIRFFRSSILLFHPDKSYGSEEVRSIQTELFKQFQQLSETSLEKIKEGLQTLKTRVPNCRFEIQEVLDRLKKDKVDFYAKMETKMEAKFTELSNFFLSRNAENYFPVEDQERPTNSTSFQLDRNLP